MRYNLSNPKELEEATEFLKSSAIRGKTVELKVWSPPRSGQQNRYLHLLINVFAVATGFNAEQSKILFKRNVNKDIFVMYEQGEPFLRSTRDLSVEEMSKAIERFKEYGRENDIDMPDAFNEEAMRYYENLVETQFKYL